MCKGEALHVCFIIHTRVWILFQPTDSSQRHIQMMFRAKFASPVLSYSAEIFFQTNKQKSFFSFASAYWKPVSAFQTSIRSQIEAPIWTQVAAFIALMLFLMALLPPLHIDVISIRACLWAFLTGAKDSSLSSDGTCAASVTTTTSTQTHGQAFCTRSPVYSTNCHYSYVGL